MPIERGRQGDETERIPLMGPPFRGPSQGEAPQGDETALIQAIQQGAGGAGRPIHFKVTAPPQPVSNTLRALVALGAAGFIHLVLIGLVPVGAAGGLVKAAVILFVVAFLTLALTVILDAPESVAARGWMIVTCLCCTAIVCIDMVPWLRPLLRHLDSL